MGLNTFVGCPKTSPSSSSISLSTSPPGKAILFFFFDSDGSRPTSLGLYHPGFDRKAERRGPPTLLEFGFCSIERHPGQTGCCWSGIFHLRLTFAEGLKSGGAKSSGLSVVFGVESQAKMTVEGNGRGGVVIGEEGSRDKFPAGMRVLAVDDDSTFLKVLEKMLQDCKYHGMCFEFWYSGRYGVRCL